MSLSDFILDTIFHVSQGRRHLYPNDCIHIRDTLIEESYSFPTPTVGSSSSRYGTNSVYGSYLCNTVHRTSFPELPALDSSRSFLRLIIISDTHGKHRSLGHLPPGKRNCEHSTLSLPHTLCFCLSTVSFSLSPPSIFSLSLSLYL